ncbi:MAG TPA: S8 family peptidase, partial [Firmicutes bacterium]|nr:S8 family peptidase [Bacillota bacterium]
MSNLGMTIAVWVVVVGALLCYMARRGRHRASTRKIVVFAPETQPEEADRIVRSMGGRLVKQLPLINGAVCELARDADAMALSAHERVARVDEDLRVQAYPCCHWLRSRSAPPTPQLPEQVPWGIARIGAPALWQQSPSTTGAGVKVAVLDTGIDLNHPDLSPNLAAGVNILNPRRPASDDNGHGTHVAGTIAAALNGLGVVGAAPQARLYPVKVLDRNGSGRLSDIVKGLEWCVQQGIQVANLSLGSPEGNATFAEAVARAAAAGVVVVAAAGNTGPGPDTLGYPARYPETIAVGATTRGDAVAGFSSRGEELDLVAPGDLILSTWLNGTYQELSGTSMAAP